MKDNSVDNDVQEIHETIAGDLAAVGGVFKDAIAIAFDGEGTSAAQELLSAFDDVTDYINNDVLVKPLDSTSLPSYCGEECLEKSVWVRRSIAWHHKLTFKF